MKYQNRQLLMDNCLLIISVCFVNQDELKFALKTIAIIAQCLSRWK